jgi:hypothetical protein
MERVDSLSGFPKERILPEEAGIRPAIILSSVVLPQPDGPTNEINSLLFSLNEML